MLETVTEEKIARKINKKIGVSYTKLGFYYVFYTICVSISINS